MKNLFYTIIILISSFIYSATSAVNILPQANLKLSSARIELGQELILDATDSLNPQGKRYGLSYRFKPNKNTAWSEFSHSPIFRYTPTNLGQETAYLEVKDTEKNYKKIAIRNYRIIVPITRDVRIRSLNNGSKNVGEEVFFQLDFIVPQNTDLLNIKARWDFDGNGTFDTQIKNIQTVSYVFQKPGTFVPKAEVHFPAGEVILVKGFEPKTGYTGRTRVTQNQFEKLRINTATITSPTVNISPSYKVYTENTSISFDATKTQTTPHSWVEFQFDGERTKIVKEKKITKKFKSPGKHQVTTRHCYNRANPVCAETTTSVLVEKDPTNFLATVAIHDLDGESYAQNTYARRNYAQFKAGKRLNFHAALNRLSSKGQHFEYRWDFDGDGNFDTPFSQKSYAEHTFARAGNYKTCVQIKNEFTQEDEALVFNSKSLEIINNQKPSGYFVFQKLERSPSEDRNNPQIFVGDRVQILPKTNDPDSYQNRLLTRFDINNDGIWETDFQYNYGFTWQFQSAGNYKGKMQIKDSNGVVQTIIQSFEIYKNPEPVIKIQVSKKRANVGEIFTLSARKSQGNKLRFTWKVPENQDIINSWTDQINVTFKTLGKKNISLLVTDNMGQKKWVEFPVWVD